MKKKTILILFLIVLIIFMIYLKTKDVSVYYVNFIDSKLSFDTKYSSYIVNKLKEEEKLEEFIEFEYEDYRITDFTKAIRDNSYIYINDKKHTIQNALIKADLLTLNIGNNDIEYGLLKETEEDIYNYLDTLLLDLDTLLTEIKKYTKEQIMLIGYYDFEKEKEKYVEYFSLKVEKICNKIGIKYINDKKINSGNVNLDISNHILSEFTFP